MYVHFWITRTALLWWTNVNVTDCDPFTLKFPPKNISFTMAFTEIYSSWARVVTALPFLWFPQMQKYQKYCSYISFMCISDTFITVCLIQKKKNPVSCDGAFPHCILYDAHLCCIVVLKYFKVLRIGYCITIINVFVFIAHCGFYSLYNINTITCLIKRTFQLYHNIFNCHFPVICIGYWCKDF